MNEKLVQNFKSYINISPKNIADKNGTTAELKPKLLNGEAVAGSAHDVTLMAPFSDNRSGKIGSLFVTNYKLSFVPIFISPDDEPYQKHLILGAYDVPLSSVESVFLTDGLSRRRRLSAHVQMPSSKIKGIQVVCKNMKVLSFTFEKTISSESRKIALALIHHANPKRHDLLFAYEHKEPYYQTLPPDLNMFVSPSEWKKELERCKCPNWRISTVNKTPESFMLTAGEVLIVPNSIVDCMLTESARHFRSGRIPVWVWGTSAGAALLRCGELASTEQAETCINTYLESIRKCHPTRKPPKVLYLCGIPGMATSDVLPPLAALQTSYKKLVELCTPTTVGGFSAQDSQYYSALESCKWLRWVALCLKFANKAAVYLHDNTSVVLQEGDGMDYCAVVSSLTQLLLDPHYRTISGLQSLIQKEWLALGHPFCDRLGLLEGPSPKQKEASNSAPVFLLFLDCVWQLQRQFPTHFQFSETYLTTLWDQTTNQMFCTFLFNCPRDRELAVAKGLIERPVWDWGEQFSEQDMSLFFNPLFLDAGSTNSVPKNNTRFSLSDVKALPPATIERVVPACCVSSVCVWAQNYERWLCPLDVLGAGPAQVYLYHMQLLSQIRRLKEKELSHSIMNNRHSNGDSSDPIEPINRQKVPRFYPFSSMKAHSGSATSLDVMHTSLIDASQLLDSQSLLNAPD